MKGLIRMMVTCRKFRQVQVVRFFRTTTNLFQFATQCVTNSVIRNFRTTALQFAALKNKIEYHFREVTKMVEIVNGGKREVEDYNKMECRIASY